MHPKDRGRPELSPGAWMFATPEDNNGGRIYADKTEWKIVSTPADDEFSARQYSFEDWDVNQVTNVAKAEKVGQNTSQATHTRSKKAKKNNHSHQSQDHAKTYVREYMRGNRSAEVQVIDGDEAASSSNLAKEKSPNMNQTVLNKAMGATAPTIVDSAQNFEQLGRTLGKKQKKKKKTKANQAKDSSALPNTGTEQDATTEALTAAGGARINNNKKDKKSHVKATLPVTAGNDTRKGADSALWGGKLEAQEKSVGTISKETLYVCAHSGFRGHR